MESKHVDETALAQGYTQANERRGEAHAVVFEAPAVLGGLPSAFSTCRPSAHALAEPARVCTPTWRTTCHGGRGARGRGRTGEEGGGGARRGRQGSRMGGRAAAARGLGGRGERGQEGYEGYEAEGDR